MPIWLIVLIIFSIFGFVNYCVIAIAGEDDEQRERDYQEWLKQHDQMKKK